MKKYIDITGTINNGMWNYDEPFPQVNIKPLPPISWLGGKTVGCEIFEGLNSQTGTYLETPAHSYGNGNSYALIEVTPEQMMDIPCVVLNVGMWDMDPALGRRGEGRPVRPGASCRVQEAHGRRRRRAGRLAG